MSDNKLDTGYTYLADHPLRDVPPEAIEAARAYARDLAHWTQLAKGYEEETADFFVIAIAQFVESWRNQTVPEGLPGDWWVSEDCATYLRIDYSTWTGYVSRGHAPTHDRKFGRTKAWRPSTVMNWRAKNPGELPETSPSTEPEEG